MKRFNRFRKLLPVLLALIVATEVQAIKITHGPYLCDMTSDGVTIVWTTDKPGVAWVEYAPDTPESFYAEARPKVFESVAGRKLATETVHRVRLNRLKSGASYRYRVCTQEVSYNSKTRTTTHGAVASTSVWGRNRFKFKTFDEQKKNISFLIFNDVHGRAPFMKETSKSVNFDALDFVLMNGDMSNHVSDEAMIFKGYMDTAVSMFATRIPIVYARGNHEARGTFANNLIKYFPTRSGNFYYMFTIGDVCFVVLDCGEDKPDSDIEYYGLADYDTYREEQAEWLSERITSDEFKNASTRIVFLHIPPTVEDWHGNNHLHKTLMPILNRAGINMMFSGHTHKYSYHPADSETAFPIMINGNDACVLVTVTNGKIDFTVKKP